MFGFGIREALYEDMRRLKQLDEEAYARLVKERPGMALPEDKEN